MVRFKNRYLLCVIDSEYGSEEGIYALQSKEILNAVRSSIAVNFGDLGMGQLMSSLAIKLWSPALSMCLIRSNREHFRTTWGAITFITHLRTAPQLGQVRLQVVHVGGTIRACQKSAIEHGRKLILERRHHGYSTKSLESAITGTKREMDAMDI